MGYITGIYEHYFKLFCAFVFLVVISVAVVTRCQQSVKWRASAT